MYSIVLMMAMTSGGDVAEFGHRHGCCGGYSSCSGGYAGCSGGYAGCSGYSGCTGGYAVASYSSCCGGYESSCCGGGRHRLFGGRRHHSSCCGGYSSCCGGYSSCSGGYVGCSGGYTGCSGGAVYGCAGGMIYGDTVPGTVVVPDAGAKPEEIKKPEDKPKPEEIKKPTDKKPEAVVPAPATIIVTLPADAQLSIDDAATTSTASPRVFTSPVLPVGQDFHYTLKAEYVRDGKPVVVTKEVTVRAGQDTNVTLDAGLVGVASR